MARAVNRWQPPPPTPGWGPLSPPTRPSSPWPRILREAAIFVALLALALRFHVPNTLLAAGVACGLVGALRNCRLAGGWGQVGRAVLAAALGGVLALIVVAGIHPPKVVKAPPMKAPVEAEANQTDYLDQLRRGVVNLYRTVASGGTPQVDKPKKGTRR